MEIIVKINDEYYFEEKNNNTYTKMKPLYIERIIWKKDHYEPEMVLEWHCYDTRDYYLVNGEMIPEE